MQNLVAARSLTSRFQGRAVYWRRRLATLYFPCRNGGPTENRTPTSRLQGGHAPIIIISPFQKLALRAESNGLRRGGVPPSVSHRDVRGAKRFEDIRHAYRTLLIRQTVVPSRSAGDGGLATTLLGCPRKSCDRPGSHWVLKAAWERSMPDRLGP